MSTYPVPTSLPVPPRAWHTDLDRQRIAAEAARVSKGAGPFPGLAVEQDPERARRLGRQVQAASRRAAADGFAPIPPDTRDERVLQLWEAANCFTRAALADPGGPIGEKARRWASEARALVAELVVAPEASRIRPEVPGTEAA